MRVARSHVAELAGRGCPSGHELISATAFGLASERERADARDHDRSPRRGPSWSASTRPKFERSRLSSTTSGSFSGSRPPPQRSTRPSNAPGASASPRPYVGWATACAADASVGPDTHIPNELRQGETARGGRSRSLHLASDVTGHTDPTSKLKAAAPSRHSRTSRARGGRSEHSCYCLEATATGPPHSVLVVVQSERRGRFDPAYAGGTPACMASSAPSRAGFDTVRDVWVHIRR